MYKYSIAKQLASKRVITSRGEEVGKVIDILVDELSGNIEYLLVEADLDSKITKTMNIDIKNRMVKIPYSAVSAVSDVFIVDEKQIVVDNELIE
jgi:sporulation protein YlmC with PRC-barrel domain